MTDALRDFTERMSDEIEGIAAIYSDEQVVSELPNLTFVPAHTLKPAPKPQPPAQKPGKGAKQVKQEALDETPVPVVQCAFTLTPRVGHELGKISVCLQIRLLFEHEVSRCALG